VNFGLANGRPVGDGVVTGYGTVDGYDAGVFFPGRHRLRRGPGEIYGE
jgi:propionyl-CoA carboxylase beta chain